MDGTSSLTTDKTKQPKRKAARLPDITPVPVSSELLRITRERTGMTDDTELVAFALRLLNEPDPSVEFARKHRGTLPGFDLDI